MGCECICIGQAPHIFWQITKKKIDWPWWCGPKIGKLCQIRTEHDCGNHALMFWCPMLLLNMIVTISSFFSYFTHFNQWNRMRGSPDILISLKTHLIKKQLDNGWHHRSRDRDDITRAGGMGETVRCSGVQGMKHLMEEVRLWVYSCVVVPCIPHLLDSLLLTNICYLISPSHPRSDLVLCCDALIK